MLSMLISLGLVEAHSLLHFEHEFKQYLRNLNINENRPRRQTVKCGGNLLC